MARLIQVIRTHLFHYAFLCGGIMVAVAFFTPIEVLVLKNTGKASDDYVIFLPELLCTLLLIVMPTLAFPTMTQWHLRRKRSRFVHMCLILLMLGFALLSAGLLRMRLAQYYESQNVSSAAFDYNFNNFLFPVALLLLLMPVLGRLRAFIITTFVVCASHFLLSTSGMAKVLSFSPMGKVEIDPTTNEIVSAWLQPVTIGITLTCLIAALVVQARTAGVANRILRS